MSYSKPAFTPTASTITYKNPFPPPSNSGSYWPKFESWREWNWTTLALGAAPIFILGAGFLYWRKSASSSTKGKKSDEKKVVDGKKPAAVIDPSKPKHLALKEQGNEYFKLSNYALALDCYNKAIEQNPSPQELATLFQNRAAVFERLKDWVQVINECDAALKLNPTYVKALHRRAKAFKETGFSDKALEDVTGVCILESFQHPSSIQLADALLQEIGAREADKLMKEKSPKAPSVHNVATFLRSFHNDPVSVIWNKNSKGVSNGSDVNGDAEHGAGERYEELKGYKLAERKLMSHEVDGLIELCTDEINSSGSYLPEAHLLRGTLRFMWGYTIPTIEDYDAVIANDQSSDEFKSAAWIKKGVYYSYLSETSDVKSKENPTTCFEEAEKLTPSNVDIFHQRGQVLLMKGDTDAAQLQINRGSELSPDFPLALASKLYLEFRLSVMNGDQQGMTETIEKFRKCLQKFPKFPDVFGLYGQMLLEVDKLIEAAEQFDKVIQLEPNNVTVMVHKAMLQYRMTNDANAALKILHDAAKIDGKSEFVYETIGTLSLQTGDLDEAAKAFSKALELAKTYQETLMLSSMKVAAEIQSKVRANLGMAPPPAASQLP